MLTGTDYVISFWTDIIIVLLLVIRIHFEALWESGMFLRIMLLMAFIWYLAIDFDAIWDTHLAFFDVVDLTSRTFVFRAVLIIGISVDLYRHFQRPKRHSQIVVKNAHNR